MLVSRHPELIELARGFRNYGKPTYEVHGLNFRMSEFTAALGRDPDRAAAGDRRLEERDRADRAGPAVQPAASWSCPRGWSRASTSTSCSTGSSGRPAASTTSPAIGSSGHDVELPNTDWVARNHSCAPLYYRPLSGELTEKGPVNESSRHRRVRVHRLPRRRQAARARARARDLRPAPVAVARARRCRDGDRLDHRPRGARARAGRTATRSPTSRRSPTSTTSTPSPRTPSRSTRAVPQRCWRLLAAPASSGSSTPRRSGSTPTARPTIVDEETLLPPPSHLYTSTKLAGELYCKAYQELYGIDYTILRFGIPYGPRAREAAVIPAFVNKALAGEPLTLAGDGLQSRRFVYVEDLADGVVAGLGESPSNRVYNLVSRRVGHDQADRRDVQELVGDIEIVYTPARPGDFGGKIVSRDRARSELGWTAATPFAEGVRRYIEWRARAGRRNEARAGSGPASPGPFSSGRASSTAGEPARATSWSSPPTSARATIFRLGRSRASSASEDPDARSRSSTACPRWGGC